MQGRNLLRPFTLWKAFIMSKREKLRRKLRDNPKAATKQDIQTLLGHFDFILDHVSGSHHVFLNERSEEQERLVIPIHGTKVKPFYVKLILNTIDGLFPIEDESSQDDSDDE